MYHVQKSLYSNLDNTHSIQHNERQVCHDKKGPKNNTNKSVLSQRNESFPASGFW